MDFSFTQSPVTLDLSSKSGPVMNCSDDGHDHSAASNDDEEDDDNDADDRIDLQVFDPERLKAFNVITQFHF